MTTESTPPCSSAVREDEVHVLLVESGRRGRAEEVARAQGFATIDAARHYSHHGCASIGEYGLRFGFGSRQAREYAAAGRVIALCPMAAEMVLAGGIAIPSLAVIEPYFVDGQLRPTTVSPETGEDMPQPFEEILRWARLLPEHELRRAVNWTRAKVRIGERPAIRTLHLTNQGVEDLDRTQVIVARKEGRIVCQSEAAERALRFYVTKHDPQETQPGTRRLEPMPARTDGTKNPRTIPAEVKRALLARHGDICAIGFCQNKVWIENSHHLAHALGGGNELPDMDYICSVHHKMKDRGEIRWVPHPDGPEFAGHEFAGHEFAGHYVTREGETLHLKPLKGSRPFSGSSPSSSSPSGSIPVEGIPVDGIPVDGTSSSGTSSDDIACGGPIPEKPTDPPGGAGGGADLPSGVRECEPRYRPSGRESRGARSLRSRAGRKLYIENWSAVEPGGR